MLLFIIKPGMAIGQLSLVKPFAAIDRANRGFVSGTHQTEAQQCGCSGNFDGGCQLNSVNSHWNLSLIFYSL
jgi:hypothetical protein